MTTPISFPASRSAISFAAARPQNPGQRYGPRARRPLLPEQISLKNPEIQSHGLLRGTRADLVLTYVSLAHTRPAQWKQAGHAGKAAALI